MDPGTQSRTLDVLGRCDRKESCESTSTSIGGLPQQLHLFNGPLLNARIGTDGGRLDELIASEKSPMEIINEFYLAALSRAPIDEEQQFWKERLDANTSDEQRAFLEDFVWGLLTCNEFTTK